MRRSTAAAVLALLAAAACNRAEPRRDPSDARPRGAGPVDPVSVRVDELLGQLRSDRASDRGEAIDQIRGLASRHALDTSEAVALLRALPSLAPPPPGGVDPQTAVVAALAEDSRMDLLPVVEEIAPRLRPAARARAIALVGMIDDPTAARTFLRLVRRHHQDSPSLAFAHLQERPQQPRVLFPALLELADHPAMFGDVVSTALAYCEQGLIAPEVLAVHADSLLATYQASRDVLVEAQRPSGSAWMWGDSYAAPREDASLLLDLFGCMPLDVVSDALADALRSYRDPRLLYVATRSWIEHGQVPAARVLDRIAASPQTRMWLFELLKDAGQLELFPARWRSQQALAESALAVSLAGPDSLGRAPDDLELVDVVSIDVGAPDGDVDFYVFRFRVHPPDERAARGWIAGVAGPYVRADAPTTDDHGGTGSRLEPADARTAAEHVGDVDEIVQEWRRARRR
jgi:hypothetical protein